MKPAAELCCYERDGSLAAIVSVGDEGVTQIAGDVELARETLRLIAADPAVTPLLIHGVPIRRRHC